MTYVNENLWSPLYDLDKAIDKYDDAVLARIKSDEYLEDHIEEIDALRIDLVSLQRRIIKLMNECQ